MSKFITIVDPSGATLGYGGPPVPISHRVLYEGKMFYGFESIQKLFSSHQEMISFLAKVVDSKTETSGTHGSLTWSVETL